MFIRLTNGVPTPYTIGQLRRDNPQVSFPKSIPDATLAEYDVYPLKATDQPSYDPITQNLTKGIPALVNGVWTQVWEISEASPEEIQQRTEDQARAVRSERDRLLQETDWIVIKAYERNENIPAAWEVYRQALRDITLQEGFPFDVTWPDKP